MEFLKAGAMFHLQMLMDRAVHRESLSLGANKGLRLASVQPKLCTFCSNSSKRSFLLCSTLPASGTCCCFLRLPTPFSQLWLLESSLIVGTNLSLCNFHPPVLILSLGTTQKKPNPSSIFHMSALQIFEETYQVSHDHCSRLNTS